MAQDLSSVPAHSMLPELPKDKLKGRAREMARWSEAHSLDQIGPDLICSPKACRGGTTWPEQSHTLGTGHHMLSPVADSARSVMGTPEHCSPDKQ